MTVATTLRGWPGRLLLAAAGLGIIAYLVRQAGPDRVAQVLLQAGTFLPIIVALELVQITSDVVALRVLLGDAKSSVPRGAWIRSAAVAYAMMILLPAGRAAGEVARAALIAKHVGTPAAATASVQLSSVYLLAIGLASAAACSVVAISIGVRTPLVGLLAINTPAIGLGSALGVTAVLRDARFGGWVDWLRRRLPHASEPSKTGASERPRATWNGARTGRAALVSWLGRSAQLVQYGVILAAVGGTRTIRGAFVAHGIHLVGATLGDLLPNQLGVVDGTYRTFAPALGLGDAPARALSIAFVAHAAQLTMATACVIVAALTRPRSAREPGAPTSARADAHS